MRKRVKMQPIVISPAGVVRFQANRLVKALLDHGEKTGLGLNELEMHHEASRAEWEQLYQLVGTSTSAFGDMPRVRKKTVRKADRVAARVYRHGGEPTR